jgi:hypothetical protein
LSFVNKERDFEEVDTRKGRGIDSIKEVFTLVIVEFGYEYKV